jgi:aerobic carbon-monoxide dehydrogenase large subunit
MRGEGQFVADIELPGMLHVVIVRSQHAHARIRSVDLSLAAAVPGVVLALTGEDLVREMPPVRDNQAALPKKWRAAVKAHHPEPPQPLLATGRVRHVGEGLALVVAQTRLAAEDAAELVTADLELLPALTDTAAALAPGAVALHEHLGTNLIGEFTLEQGNVAAAMQAAGPCARICT